MSNGFRQYRRPVTDLDRLPRLRRWIMGLGALIVALVAGFVGFALIIAATKGVGLGVIWFIGFGGAFTVVAAFMFLVWLRLWFGKQRSLEVAILSLWAPVSVFLMLGTVVLCAFVVRELLRG